MPCVGLIVFLGSFTFLIAPDTDFLPAHSSTAPPPVHKIPPPDQLPTIVIDPGHGGIDEGTAWYGLREKDVTLDVAERLQRFLTELRLSTVLTRTTDTYVSLPERVGLANRLDNALFVSIHFNQAGEESVDGVETYYADQKIPPAQDWTWMGFFSRPEPQGDTPLDNGENFAAQVQASVAARMLIPNRGIKSKNLYVVRHTRMPAILVEGGFLSNKVENQLLRNDDYRERLARALAVGIASYVRTTHPDATLPAHLASADPPKTLEFSR